jgi:cell division protein FtsA
MALPPVVSLEIGTTRVRALIGEQLENGQIMVTGMGECASRGVRKGEIIHFENALSCVRNALDMAEEQSRVEINEVHLLVTGGHIQGVINHGNVPVESGEITEEDIERAMEVGRTLNLPHDRAVLHTINQHFYVDDQAGVLDPAGMDGAKLSVDMLILHGIRNRIKNAVKILKSTHVDVHDVAFSGLCSGLAVLTPEQKESGVIVIDLGGGTTDYLVYGGQAIACAGSLAVGGDHITNDIAMGLSIPLTQAERLKVEWGRAVCEGITTSQTVSLQAEGGFHGKHIRLIDLNRIIQARVEEILTMVKAEITRYNPLSMAGAGVLLTGGGAHLKGVTGLTSQLFQMPCHVGIPRNISGLAVVTEGPEYAAPLGMIRYGFKTGGREEGSGWFNKIFSMFRR